MALNELLNEPLVKLTKPSIFVASSTRAKGDVVAAFRAAIDACRRGESIPEMPQLADVTEGQRETSGAYRRAWR